MADKTDPDLREWMDLLDVAKLVVSTLEMGQVMEAILKSAMKITGASAGSIALYHKETQELEIRAHKGFSQGFINSSRWAVREGGLTAEILKSKEPMVITDTTNKEFFTNPLAISEGIKSVVCVPLYIEEEVIGILYVDEFTPRKFSERELRPLSILSSFAAMSIDHAKLHELTMEMALTDSLTGLHNTRCFHGELSKEVGRATRFKESMALMMIDIDDFKKVNDTFGHPFGDKVLQNIAETLKCAVRISDMPSRYGGEEFVVVLPMTDSAQATVVAQRVLQGVRASSTELMKGKPPVTVSIGIASFPKDARDGLDLIQKADEALYRAKRAGKDRAVEYTSLR